MLDSVSLWQIGASLGTLVVTVRVLTVQMSGVKEQLREFKTDLRETNKRIDLLIRAKK